MLTKHPGPTDSPFGSFSMPATIGRFRLLEHIGAGAFGSVYKAHDPESNRLVAVKTCSIGEDGHPRFLREARLAAGLRHPNITATFESGMDGPTPFMVEELLTGRDLSALIAERQPYALEERRRILVGIADGLDYAHRQTVIHRDIKPSNVRVLEDGTAKIMDFGIAKTLGSTTGMTRASMAVGTLGYMSPEQVCGNEIGARTDIFLLGLVAYELLSFQRAFRDRNLLRLMDMIVREDPDPLIDVAPWVPDSMTAIVMRALRKDPEERFASAGEMRDAMAAVRLA